MIVQSVYFFKIKYLPLHEFIETRSLKNQQLSTNKPNPSSIKISNSFDNHNEYRKWKTCKSSQTSRSNLYASDLNLVNKTLQSI